ncbi:MAG: GldG family protein [Treponema sp.]|nr:GldG family protein [Treponema sp.]
MTKKQATIITLLSVLAFILALVVTGRYWLRFDLTRTRAFSISQVSRNLHRDIQDPVNITYYLSPRLRTLSPEPGMIEDMLREYAAHSRGRIRLAVRDPLRVMDTVESFGLQPRQVPIVEQDQTSLITVFSGIVIEYLDRVEVLPWVFSTDTLEYDLTSRIRSMITDTERWVGIIIGDSVRQWGDDFGHLARTLFDAGYRVRLISPGDEIPDDLPGLLVLGGVDELDDWALYRIDRYIQLGGRVLFAARGVDVDTIFGSLEVNHFENPILLDMLASYGVIVRPELALDRNALTLQFQQQLPNGWMTVRRVQYPLWIAVHENSGNPEHPVTAGFHGLDLYWTSPLSLNTPYGVEATVMFTSSPNAWSMVNAFHTNPEHVHMMEFEANLTWGQQILGASLRGTMPSFFRGAPTPQREGFDEELPDMPLYASPARIIVIGGADFATNMIEATQARQNLDFLLRAVDWLVTDDDIVNIRNRQPHIGRFDRITDEQQRTAAMRFTQILNVIIVPLLVILAGFVRAFRRSRAMRLALADTSTQTQCCEGNDETQIKEGEK